MTPNSSFDPGLTQQYTGSLLRAINKDGSFNVRRRGLRGLAGSTYMHLVTMPWTRFFSVVILAYLLVNFSFASLYLSLGRGVLHSGERDLGMSDFSRALFFSVQTLTTVGYGALYPFGMAANAVAAVEAGLGLMGFALATGLLFARFSRPTAKLVFSDQMIVAPYQEGTSLQFRIANRRGNVLMEVQADMMLATVELDGNGHLQRRYTELRLERKSIFFLALTWTVVHPIDAESPLWGKSAADLEALQAEVMILIKGYDDTFSQVVNTRYSYRWDEVQWSARFVPAFEVHPAGHMELDLTKISHTISVTP